MAANKIDARQSRLAAAQAMIGSAAGDTLETIFPKINNELAKLFEDRNILLTDGGLITFTGTQLQFTETLNLVINQKISGAAPQVISLGSSTQTLANGDMWYATVDRGAGTATTTIASTLPAVVAANQEIFLIAKRVDAGDGTQRVYWRTGMALNAGQTVRLGSSGSGSGGNGTPEPIPGYQWLEIDTFDVLQTAADSKVTVTNYTNATQNMGKNLYVLSCDKSRTVNTSSGTALTINLAAGFTVAIGDIVYITSGARVGQWRRISAVGSQTSFTLDAAFTGGNAANGDTLMLSQAVWSKDLVNLGDATELTRARDFFSGNIVQVAVDYFDSLATDDDVPNYVSTANIVMGASNEGLLADSGVPTSDTFGNQIFTRTPYPAQIDNFTLSTNSDQERLFLCFFCNPNNGSVTTVANLLGYEANFYADDGAVNSGVLESALCFSDGSTTEVNCSVSTPSGLTRVQLDWSYSPNVNSGGPNGQLQVYVDGKEVSRYIGSGETPSSDLYYTEQTDSNGIYNTVQFTSDLSVAPIEIKVLKRFGVYDASDANSAKLASLSEAIVGSSAQVTAGVATHTTLTSALAAIVDGGKILVLNNVTITDGPTINKRCMIEGKGSGSTITGNVTVSSAAARSIIFALRIDGNITFQSGADKCFMTHCYQSASKTFTNDPSNTDNVIDVITE